MHKKKRFYVCLLAVIAILAVGFVVAQDEDDVDLAPFDASVNIQNQAPFVADVVERVDEVGVPAVSRTGIVDPVSGTTVNTDILVKVEDNNGAGDISGVTAQYSAPSTAPGVLRPAAPAACVEVIPCTSGCSSNQKEFRCTISLNYYDVPSVGGTDNWDVAIVVTDNVASTGTCSLATTTGCGAGVDIVEEAGALPPNPDSDLEFVYNVLKSLTVPAPCPGTPGCELIWSGISVTASDQIADGSLSLLNRGNAVLDNLRITAFDLVGQVTPAQIIPSEEFSVSALTGGVGCTGSGCTECNWNEVTVRAFRLPEECGIDGICGGAGAADDPVSIGAITAPIYGLSVPFGDGVGGNDKEDSWFCIWDSLSTLGLSSQAYKATGGDQWKIDIV